MRLLLVDVTKLVCPLSLSSSGNALRISRSSGMVIFSIFRCHELCSRLSPPLFFVAGYRSTGSRTDRKANPQPRAPVWLRGSGLFELPKRDGVGWCIVYSFSKLSTHATSNPFASETRNPGCNPYYGELCDLPSWLPIVLQ